MNADFQKFLKLVEANRILSSTLNLSDLLRQTMKLATEVVEAESSSLLLYDEKAGDLVFDLALTEKETELKAIRIKLGEGIAGWAAQNRKSRVSNDVGSDPHWTARADASTRFKTNSIIAVPMLYKGRLLGVVESVNKKSGPFGDEDLVLLEAFAGQAAVAIENARLFSSLQEEKEKIEAVFSQMSDGAVLSDAAGIKLMFNGAAGRLVGQENIKCSLINDIFAGFSQEPGIDVILSSEQRTIPFEFKRSSGKTLYLSGNASSITGQDGKVLGRVMVFRDVTEEKKETLLKRNFLSLMSHKLKTPLVTITGYGPLLMETKLDDMQKRAVQSIHKQGMYLASLVDKLLYFTMAENNDLELAKKKAEFQMIADRAVLALKQFLDERGAKVRVDEGVKDLPALDMDSEKMEAVLRNLVENAVKFNRDPGALVQIRPRKEKGFAGLAVEDNGPGIPPEERDKIFQKFYQIEESFTGQVEGVGLGLTLVKQIVEAHGGRMGLETEIGKGSSFYFLLPV
jgi:PAS domain S-box-containing protein